MKTLGAVMILLWMGLVLVAAESESSTQPDTYEKRRDMIIEMKVELRHNKEQLQVVEKRAEAVEKRAEAAEQREEAVETGLRTQLQAVETELRTQLQAVETRLRAIEKTVEDQKVVIKELTEKQNCSAVAAVGGQVEELRRDREDSRVSFSTGLSAGGEESYGPFDVATPLVFKKVFTNVGSAYNVITGAFTVPVRGVYHFVLFVFGNANSDNSTGASLHHNGNHIVLAYGHQMYPHHVNPANGVSLLLEVGDVVQVKLWPKSWVRDSENHHTTFSGHLLFTM